MLCQQVAGIFVINCSELRWDEKNIIHGFCEARHSAVKRIISQVYNLMFLLLYGIVNEVF